MERIIKLITIIIFTTLAFSTAISQMGEGLGTEVMRQELEEANESDEKIYEKTDTSDQRRYQEKPTEKVNEDSITDGEGTVAEEVMEEEQTFTEDKYEWSSWIYIAIGVLALLIIIGLIKNKKK
ncbi:MAG: hypothetical protein Kapaf2KO_10330 [Candidatus Kapaibacteriales bacterium]